MAEIEHVIIRYENMLRDSELEATCAAAENDRIQRAWDAESADTERRYETLKGMLNRYVDGIFDEPMRNVDSCLAHLSFRFGKEGDNIVAVERRAREALGFTTVDDKLPALVDALIERCANLTQENEALADLLLEED